MKLVLAGFTILACSGDDGAVGMHYSLDDCNTMEPIFPASSPYITSVGATSVEPASSSYLDDNPPPVCTNTTYNCACSTRYDLVQSLMILSSVEQPALRSNSAQFDTGGGFSNFSGMPDYQKNAVQAYLKSGVTLPKQGLWNASGRGSIFFRSLLDRLS